MKIFSQNPLDEIKVAEEEVALNIQDILKHGIMYITAEHVLTRYRSLPNIPCNTTWYIARCQCASGNMPEERRKLIVKGDIDVPVE
jgi:hypothetical protein